jgi:hypothetical protein
VLWLAFFVAVGAATTAPAAPPRYWEPVAIDASAVQALLGARLDRIVALRCGAEACEAVPLQVDERDENGEWILPDGAAPTGDDSPGVLDANDVLVFMSEDAGGAGSEAARRAGASCEVRLDDPLGYPPRYLYLAVAHQAPAPPGRYVGYEPDSDRLHGVVTLGFDGGVPSYLSLPPDPTNVLDRLKIRATATFLWGLFGVTRSEEDLLPEAPSWSAGPVRVIRRQSLQIRMRFGLRSPRFVSTALFYRDFVELPLRIRLRVPPRYFFTNITVSGGLDLRGLPGEWDAILPGGELLPANCVPGREIAVDGVAGDWLALVSREMPAPGFTVLQRLHRGATLAAVHESAWYRCGAIADPPENQDGQCPGLGFILDDWSGVEGGEHTLVSSSYAIRPEVGLDAFLATLEAPLIVTVVPLDPR